MPIVTYKGSAFIMAKVVEGAVEGVSAAAEDLVAQAQAAAPVDTGTLRASIHVEDVGGTGRFIEAKVATGGESSEYAIYQHEGTEDGVPATKFLEGPLIANREVYIKMIADAVNL